HHPMAEYLDPFALALLPSGPSPKTSHPPVSSWAAPPAPPDFLTLAGGFRSGVPCGPEFLTAAGVVCRPGPDPP
ncbi:MAG: hypothetical protein WBC31_05220, partial [Candidatus Phosphoribacter baldrii]